MGTVLLVLVAMTAVGTAAWVTITAPWFVGRDLQQPQQQQQAMISRMMNNSGPPITAAFSISEKLYHHPKIPATKTHFLLKIDSTILNWLNSKNWVFCGFAGHHIVGCLWIVIWVFFSDFSMFYSTSFGDWTRPQHQETSLKLYPLRSRTIILEKHLRLLFPISSRNMTPKTEKNKAPSETLSDFHRRISVLLL